jgi:uncharacterized membrane protein
MDLVDNDFDYERAFAVNVAARRYPTFAAYASEQRLFERFTPQQAAQIRNTYEHWHAVVSHREAGLVGRAGQLVTS